MFEILTIFQLFYTRSIILFESAYRPGLESGPLPENLRGMIFLSCNARALRLLKYVSPSGFNDGGALLFVMNYSPLGVRGLDAFWLESLTFLWSSWNRKGHKFALKKQTQQYHKFILKLQEDSNVKMKAMVDKLCNALMEHETELSKLVPNFYNII